jgi:site-specific recombinase XerD
MGHSNRSPLTSDELRVSELIKLKLIDVGFTRNQINITKKGDKGKYLHLNGGNVGLLINHVANRPRAQNSRFFITTNGQNLSRRYFMA